MFSCIVINLCIARPLDMVFFVFYERNEFCVSGQFLPSFDDRFVCFFHSGIVGSI